VSKKFFVGGHQLQDWFFCELCGALRLCARYLQCVKLVSRKAAKRRKARQDTDLRDFSYDSFLV